MKWISLISLIACLMVGAGCHSTERFTDPVLGPSYVPKNVFLEPGAWQLTLRRVAILPMACDESDPVKVNGCETLQPILLTELGKSQHFECVILQPELLKKISSRPRWSASERLPVDLLEMIGKETGCDAVLFAELSDYRPYSPLVIGWNIKLVELKTHKVLWAVDETFDAGESTVANGARRFQMDQQQANPVLSDSRQVLSSPRLFGKYTARTVVGTLPDK
jgi:hypothetical protein